MKMKSLSMMVTSGLLLLVNAGCYSFTTHDKAETADPLYEGKRLHVPIGDAAVTTNTGSCSTNGGVVVTQRLDPDGFTTHYEEKGIWPNPFDWALDHIRGEKIEKHEKPKPVPPAPANVWYERGVDPITGQPCIFVKRLVYCPGP